MQLTELKGFNLSIQQTRLWSLQKDSRSYRAQCAVRLEGKLNVGAFLLALQSLVDRHTILRTKFHRLPAMEIPLQLVGDQVKAEYMIVDLQNLPEELQTSQFHLCYEFLQNEPFNFEHSPLMYARLLRLSRNTHLFIISLPALSADDTTLVQVVAELSKAYSAALREEPLTDEPLQYVDVSAWQDMLLKEDERHSREYWREIDLHHLEPIRFQKKHNELISASQIEEQQQADFTPGSLAIPLDKSLSKQLQELTSASTISLTAWLLTCWQVTISHLLDASNIVIGVACDGRMDEELADALGLYTRFVPFRARLVDDMPFKQALALTTTSLEETLERQLYFTWETQQESKQDTTRSSFFPLCFEYVTWPTSFQTAELTISLDQRYCYTEPFSLKLSALLVGEHIRLELHYDQAEVAKEQAMCVASALLCILKTAVTQPQALVGNFPLLPANEQEHVRHLLRGPVTPQPARTWHQLFEEQAEHRPLQLAVIDAAEQMSYNELNRKANQLAHYLRRQGIGPNVLVGLCMTRSVSMIIGLLAILKAGGAYVALDPESPSRRLAYQLQESHAALLLTQQALLSSLPDWNGHTLCLENIMQETCQEQETNLEISYAPQDLAYVIYTSGSTGVPKGVMIQQQSIVNYTLAMCNLLEVKPGWHYATVSTLAADLGNTVIFCALASGGCLQVLDYATATSTEAFHRWIEHYPIDVLKIVPSHLLALLTGRQAHTLLPQRALILGGETLTHNLLQQLRTLHGSCVVYNHYGPTETTIGVLLNMLGVLEEATGQIEEETIPLGRPIANTEALILSRGQQIVPVGVIGELYLSGRGMAMGYLHQPEQTAERFVPNPFSTHAGERLYRTGDLAHYTTAGQIEFLGRRDSQVKIRGYRLELGEIEAVLRSHANVWQAVVAVRKDMALEEPQLVGYVTAWNQSAVTAEALRKFVGEYVPEYMVPSTIMVLKEFPLTANGKVDRQRLPRPEQIQLDELTLVTAPRSPIEEILLEIWQNLLALPVISIHENFFRLGGHSLLATQIVSRIQVLLQVELPILSLFEAPTIAELALRVEKASQTAQGQAIPALLPEKRPQELPLSFAQQRLWFLDQLEPGSTAYLIPAVQRLEGSLDVKVLEQCLIEMMQRHEVLRTTFEERDGQPVQVIHPHAQETAFFLPLVDLTCLDDQEREEVARHLARHEHECPFDLARGPLLRGWLLRLAPAEHILLLTLHHIITDGWSNTILRHELSMLYRAFVTGQPSPLTALPIQYADYALWQRSWLQGELLAAQLDYWKGQLAGLTPLELPTDHPRPSILSGRGASQSVLLAPPLQQELIALSQREGVTLFMTLLTAFQVLLARYSGQSDIAVGSPIANRTRGEIEGLVGFFVNTLVLRSDLSGQPNFVELLGRVQQVALGAYAHQDVPFEMLVEQLEPQRDLSRSPLFQVAFSLQQPPETTETLEGVVLSSLEVESNVSKFDLTLTITSRAQGLVCHLSYNTDLFEASTIQRLLEHWQVLLQGIVAHPHQSISTLPLLPLSEQQALLLDWNTSTREQTVLMLHQLIEAQAEATPDRIAVVFEEMQLSYGELNARANQLAHHLQHLGVGPEIAVGVCLDRSLHLVISLLALLKIGGMYLPLDPTYPQERLAFLMQDAHAPFLLTTQSLHITLPGLDLSSVYLDQDWSTIAQQSNDNPAENVSGEYAAYVIYTSGSTGVPKGVVVTGNSLLNLCLWYASYSDITEKSIVLLAITPTFDASIKNILTPLLSGGQLVLGSAGYYDAREMVRVIQHQGVTVINSTPGMFATFLDEAASHQFESLAGLKYVHLGGEALTLSLLNSWRQGSYTSCTITNIYGPTECTDITTCYTLDDGQITEGEVISIGYPIDNIQAYVLNEQLQLAPVGVPGELYIGGQGVARGYLNKADLTAASFIPHPFSSESGGRLYKTGDLVRYRSNGRLEFLGRVDQQVKLRGFRIELGEIEAVLRGHPGIGEVVVQVWQGEREADRRLVAYVMRRTGEVGEQITSQQVREFVRERLPEYMVPAQVQWLETIPLTAHGKIDRRALPAPEHLLGTIDKEWIGTRSPLEETLAEIWSMVVGRPPRGVNENFFEAGGHSLLAAQLIARVRKLLGAEVPLRALFEAPTVAGLTQRVEQALRSEQGIELTPLVPRPHTQEVPLSFAQQRLWFLDQLEPGSTAYNLPQAVWLRGQLVRAALDQALTSVIERHESLRTSFPNRHGEPVQWIATGPTAHLIVLDLSALASQEREQVVLDLVRQEAKQPFDLRRGPLLRCFLLQLNKQEQVLLLTMHHIISDGWSSGILVRDLTALYAAQVQGAVAQLPALPVQYADYAIWQRQWLQGPVLQQELDYWKQQLADLPYLDLPTDHPRPPFQSFRGARQHLLIPVSLHRQLQALSMREGVTLFMTLLAAFQVLLARYSGQSDITVGSPISNRTHEEVEGLIGFFVNTLVLRTDLSGNPTFLELLARVRTIALQAYIHQDVPFERIVEAVQPERDPSRNPLFQVHFALQNMPEIPALQIPLEIEDFGLERYTVRFDLSLSLSESEQGLRCKVGYNTDLFEAATIEHLLEHWQILLGSIVDHPQSPLSELSLLSEAERILLLNYGNTQLSLVTSPELVPESFARQAALTPDAIALHLSNCALSYKALDRRANQLAHHLRSLGVGPDVLVGLLLDRSFDQLIAILAVFKAGGAYVPLDPSLPDTRLAFLLQDAHPYLILSRSDLTTRPLPWTGPLLSLEQDAPLIARFPLTPPDHRLSPEHLAYLIYTSGSTGTPKGVLLSHRGLVHLAQQQIAAFQVEPRSRVLQFASSSFDASVSEILMAWLSGATLCLCEEEQMRAGLDLVTLLELQAITTITLPPSALSTLPLRALPCLQSLVVAGEAITPALAAQWAAQRRFYNAYGPTEATVCATLWEGAPLPAEASLPIGYPLAHAQTYVLDTHLQMVPNGAIGELYLGGLGLARGYHRRADLTAERFLPHPFSQVSGERLYRTGDLVRYHADGNLEYMGRVDQQVKIRGYRIEPAEIEAILQEYPGVRESLVLARSDLATEPRLLAYVVAHDPSALNGSELRHMLQETLPGYMVPSWVLVLNSFPLKPNGKIDRQALPSPEEVSRDQPATPAEPLSALERYLAEVWQEALDIENIELDDSFFEMGGESITGAILMNKLQERFEVPLYVVTLFDAPTIRLMARFLSEHYAQAIERLLGISLSEPASQDTDHEPRITENVVEHFRSLLPSLPPRAPTQRDAGPRNPPAIFVLSPPRSGSTLFRVLLGGNPQLFAPPELELLSFNTLQDRHEAFTGRDSFWLEGTIRTLMEIKGWDMETARQAMTDYEDRGLTAQQFYAEIQSWIGERVLVDKTPAYSLDQAILQRAETDFTNTKYIHLIRHPYGMIRSFEEAKSELGFFRYDYSGTPRELAELIWVVCQQNIMKFLSQIPAERQYHVHFEELVNSPEAALRKLCHFLEVEFNSEMLQPYKQTGKMTDGIHPLARMLGDVKFHTHKAIDASVAERWQEVYKEDFLGEITWQLAEHLGYQREKASSSAKGSVSAEGGLQPIAARAQEAREEIPLSFAQQRLWFLAQLEPDNISYQVPSALSVQGPLESRVLEQSLWQVIRRHEILRTTFEERDGQPVQVIHSAAEVTALLLTLIDLRGLSGSERQQVAHRLADQERQRPFDLAHGPLLRAYLLWQAPQEHVLLLTLHHIIIDGWSSAILQRELRQFYQASMASQPLSLAPLPIQYADYALWQHNWLQDAQLAGQLDYWKGQLSGLVPLELPTDYRHPPISTGQGAFQELHLARELQQKLTALSQQADVTLFMLLLAAFQLLLARYSGQQDISVGTAMANRPRAELEGLIGFFVNTLVLRGDLSGDPRFSDLLIRVRQCALEAYAHQDVPFEQVVEMLQPERDLSRSPLFQVMFGVEQSTSQLPGAQEIGQIDGLTFTGLSQEHLTAKFDLSFTVTITASGLRCGLEYSTDLFAPQTIERLLLHWQFLLEGIVATPQARLSQLPLLTSQERRRLLSWNASQLDTPQELCLHELVEAQVRRTPEAIALLSQQHSFTYESLNAHANQLAHFLHHLGAGPEVRIGLCLERGPELLIALLAILKTGAAYLPLDPNTPSERLAFILQDAQVPLLLTRSSLHSTLAEQAIQLLCLEEIREQVAHESRENLPRRASPDNLAYVIYTSGSTGQPKGTLIPHRGVVDHTLTIGADFGLQPGERVVQFASIGFDVAVEEIFPTWASGATLLLRPEEIPTPGELLRWAQQQQVSVLNLPTAYWQNWVAELRQEAMSVPASLRLVVVGGEAALTEQLAHWQAHTRETVRWINAYGPTETTITSTRYEAAPGSGERGPAMVSLGTPLPNRRAYVLNEHQELVPVGVAGELCLGGAGLARGYHQQADLTAERFVPDPFSGQPGARLYRTGDRVRYQADGTLHFLGRLDQQVKLRGYRIELGEIEAILEQHPGVRQSIVLLREDREGMARLVAYVVNQEASVELPTGELRSYLQEKMPAYMVPQSIVMLPVFSLTTSGKVDRKALPMPEAFAGETDSVLEGPRNSLEETLVEIWSQVLGRPPHGIHEHFFEAGGHSLLAARFIARVRKLLEVEVPLRALFEAPTIARLAAVIEQELAVLVDQVESEELALMLKAVEELSEEDAMIALDSILVSSGEAKKDNAAAFDEARMPAEPEEVKWKSTKERTSNE